MPNKSHKSSACRIATRCYPFLLLGSSNTQVSFALFGVISVYFGFHVYPNTGFDEKGLFTLLPISVVAAGLLAAGIAKTWENLKILRNGEVFSARVLRVKENTVSEEIEYKLTCEYLDVEGRARTFETIRGVNDLAIGQSFRLLVNYQLGAAVLEPNLPGGITFRQIYGDEEIPRKFWVRILVIPVLALVPFLGVVDSVSVFVQQVANETGILVLPWLTVIIQFMWYFHNRRYFSPGKSVPIRFEAETG